MTAHHWPATRCTRGVLVVLSLSALAVNCAGSTAVPKTAVQQYITGTLCPKVYSSSIQCKRSVIHTTYTQQDNVVESVYHRYLLQRNKQVTRSQDITTTTQLISRAGDYTVGMPGLVVLASTYQDEYVHTRTYSHVETTHEQY